MNRKQKLALLEDWYGREYVFQVDELAGFEFGPGEIITTDMLPEDECG
jgi:hypothetical protein